MEQEIWKDVVGYEELYQVSNLGRVKSFRRSPNGVILKKRVGGNLYDRAYLGCKDKSGDFNVHRLVAEAFIPNPENKPYINHINGIRDDNRVENLEWCTASENHLHKFRSLGYIGVCGEKHGNSLLRDKDVIQILYFHKLGYKNKEIASIFNVDNSTISDILRGKNWSHLTKIQKYVPKNKNLS